MPSSGVQTCARSEEHTSELQSHDNLVCRLLLEKRQLVTMGSHVGFGPRGGHRGCPTTPLVATPVPPLTPALTTRPSSNFPLPSVFFFLNDTPPPEFYPLPLRGALPS